MEVEKRSSKGGFLQLFDWNAKSRKKLFSNKPDLPESSKQGKENLDNLATSRLQQMKLHESMHGPSLIGNDWDSSMNNDEGCGTKAPGVVARLMGLDSLPTLDASDPGFTPFIDSQSFRHSYNPRLTTEFETEHNFVNYGMRNKLDGFSRNPVEDRLQKLQNRPIERFKTEALPPKSAKSVPISHHRMLSPIKSPGFILSKNAAYIMETASKMIEQSPQSTLGQRSPSFRSSSIPLRIRDLKEKMEAAQRTPKSHTPVSVNSSKSQRKCRTEIVVLKQSVPGSLKNKNKSVIPPPTPLKTDKLEGTTSRNSRIPMKQKEDLEKKQRNTPKKVHIHNNRSTTTGKSKTNEVLTQNNQKQNCASNKDRSSLKPKVPYQNKPKKGVEASRKESLPKTKGISGKKRPTDGDTTNSVMIKEKERSVKCNISIDGSSNWESVDMKNGMDVVSFTFTSPIKKPESESCGQSGMKKRGLSLKFDDQIDLGTSKLPTFGTPMIDSDALSVLLEQKLKELSCLVETSQSDIVNEGSSPNSDRNDNNMQKDKGIIQDDCDKPEWQGVEVRECNSDESGTTTLTSNCITSNSTTTLTSNGNKEYPYTRNMEHLAEEIELQDSATSLPNSNTIFQFTSMTKWSSQWELEYIKKVLTHAELLLDQKGINVNLYDHLETHNNKNMDPYLKVQRKAIFDCVSLCVDGRRERAFNGSYEEWAKWSLQVKKKELLADEIWKEICGWTNMEEMEVDEVVEKDMSSGEGKWLDFEIEALEEGMLLENHLLTALIDEIIVDFLHS
ncbi:uncharacterized protein LOC111878889 [Lactuca sativa]|uniref:uncharacterized protein LOC111878889 n=1 Tax=Lactuca sativa TaxID=4236 RepID=UPI000CD82141|nr:uncharacterized protein LOC111878889 [Lactuca sativa]